MKSIEMKESPYSVVYSIEDGEFVGTHKDYPSLSYMSHDESDALNGIKALVVEAKEDQRQQQALYDLTRTI